MGCFGSKIAPLNMNYDMVELADKFCLSDKELDKLWLLFNRIDTDASGTVSIIEIFQLIGEKPTSVIAPYLISYISDIEKSEEGDRMTFIDFIRSICKY